MTRELVRGADDRLTRSERVIEGEIVGDPPLPRRVERPLTHAVAKQYARGALGVIRVETTARVAQVALDRLASLEREEAAATARDPMNSGHRQRLLVDAFTSVAGDAIQSTGSRLRSWT